VQAGFSTRGSLYIAYTFPAEWGNHEIPTSWNRPSMRPLVTEHSRPPPTEGFPRKTHLQLRSGPPRESPTGGPIIPDAGHTIPLHTPATDPPSTSPPQPCRFAKDSHATTYCMRRPRLSGISTLDSQNHHLRIQKKMGTRAPRWTSGSPDIRRPAGRARCPRSAGRSSRRCG
jgi:hypothetical protein